MSEDITTDGNQNYWWLNADPRIWSFSEMNVGEIQSYTLLNDNGNRRRIYTNFLDVKVGDVVIGYDSTPTKKIVALCKITQEANDEKIEFEKTENLVFPISYSAVMSTPEMRGFDNKNGSLFKLDRFQFNAIMDMIREQNPLPTKPKSPVNFDLDFYDENKFRSEVFMPGYKELIDVLKDKKNIILQGAPGVGKTYTARRIAYLMMGKRDDDRIEFVQFHQNYSYEDFIMGYKPNETGFELTNGIFYRFCKKAANQPDKDFFFIIDEINRGNMSKIFGELLTLIEKDYRGTKATLSYSGEMFSVPANVYIVGMMNTADRSLAVIDYALRRRFGFFEIEPGFDTDGFKAYARGLHNAMFDNLIDEVKKLNEEIESDDSLGKGFKIGHSYFCNWKEEECTKEKMLRVVKYDILPTLAEYWFDDKDKYKNWEGRLTRAVENAA